MTLAIELEALEELATPEAVFRDARRWSTYVGVISDQPAYFVKNYLQEHDVPVDDLFYSWLDKRKSLEGIVAESDTDRHVVVAATEELAAIAPETGWEHLPVREAAEKADWELRQPSQASTSQ